LPRSIRNLEFHHRPIFGSDRILQDAAQFVIYPAAAPFGPGPQFPHDGFVNISDDQRPHGKMTSIVDHSEISP
jgi:hypothetical protein